MKKYKLIGWALLAVAGAISLCLGRFVFAGEAVKTVSGMFFGLGAAMFSLGIGNFISMLVISRIESKPEYAEETHQKEVEVNDERNVQIKNKVGAKINQILIYVLSAMVLAFGFMGVDLFVIIIIASIFLLEAVLAVVLTNYYSKRM